MGTNYRFSWGFVRGAIPRFQESAGAAAGNRELDHSPAVGQVNAGARLPAIYAPASRYARAVIDEPSSPVDLTDLLNRSGDDPDAAAHAYAVIYADLKRLARRHSGPQGADWTLSATALINEAYEKLSRAGADGWTDRRHFLRVAARAMRQITIDHARTRTRAKRGGKQPNLTLDDERVAPESKPEILIAIDEGLELLRTENPRWADIVEMRFFAGITSADIAETLEISLSTVNREWAAARAWLREFLLS